MCACASVCASVCVRVCASVCACACVRARSLSQNSPLAETTTRISSKSNNRGIFHAIVNRKSDLYELACVVPDHSTSIVSCRSPIAGI